MERGELIERIRGLERLAVALALSKVQPGEDFVILRSALEDCEGRELGFSADIYGNVTLRVAP